MESPNYQNNATPKTEKKASNSSSAPAKQPFSTLTHLNKKDSMSSVFVSDSDDELEINYMPCLQDRNDLDHFLSNIQTPRYKHQVLFRLAPPDRSSPAAPQGG